MYTKIRNNIEDDEIMTGINELCNFQGVKLVTKTCVVSLKEMKNVTS